MSRTRSQGTPASFFGMGVILMILGKVFSTVGDNPTEAQHVVSDLVFWVGFLVAIVGAVAQGIKVSRDQEPS